MKKRKKMLAVISAVAAISAMCSAVAFAEDEVVTANTEEEVTQAASDAVTGTHGNLTWRLEGGTLTFSGGGYLNILRILLGKSTLTRLRA